MKTLLFVFLLAAASAMAQQVGDQQTPVAGTPSAVRVGGNVAEQNLMEKVEPVYPPLALQAHIQGTVRFTAVIDKEGHISKLTLVSGHPLLVTSAQEAVQKWVYRPTLLNGEPVAVITTIEVPFSL